MSIPNQFLHAYTFRDGKLVPYRPKDARLGKPVLSDMYHPNTYSERDHGVRSRKRAR